MNFIFPFVSMIYLLLLQFDKISFSTNELVQNTYLTQQFDKMTWWVMVSTDDRRTQPIEESLKAFFTSL